jgi:hypothetical protein
MVRGVASEREFVEAAKIARERLLADARDAGADVVKIERISLDDKKFGVVLAGHAYRRRPKHAAREIDPNRLALY